MASSRIAALVLLTALLAFVAGRVTAPKRRAPSAAVPASSSLAPDVVARAAAAAGDGDGDGVDDDGADDDGPAEQPAPAWLVREYEAEVKRLRSEVQRLEGQVKNAEAAQHEAEGRPIAFPEGKEQATEQQALLSTLQAALAAEGLDGEVSAVDCSEYPCIAHGKIAGVHDDDLNAAVASAKQKLGGLPYAAFNRFVDDKDPQKSQTTFSISLYPEGLPEDEQQNLNKRLRARKNAYVDASP